MNVRFAFSHNFGTGLDLYDSLAPTRWNLAFQRRISEIHASFTASNYSLFIDCCRISTPKQDIASACECDSPSFERNHSGYNFPKCMDKCMVEVNIEYKTYHFNDKNKI